MDYSLLKAILKKLSNSPDSEESVELSFIATIDAEVKKVNDFFLATSQQLATKMDSFNKLVTHENFYVSSPETLQAEIEGFVGDLVDLHYYTKVNFEGFRKIMKKHDRHTGRQGRLWFMQRLKEQPFCSNSQQFSTLIIKFSKCCAGCRRLIGGEEVPQLESTKGLKFTETSYKMFVKNEDIMTIKTELARRLPIFLRQLPTGGKSTQETCGVWNCYYDDEELSSYEQKFRPSEENVSLRFRTFESEKMVQIERKITYGDIRRKAGAGKLSSVKDTLELPYHDIFDFVVGSYSVTKYTNYLNGVGVPLHEIQSSIDLFTEIQAFIKEKNLKPVLSTRFSRTYFQIPGNKSITASLDEDVEIIKEEYSSNPKYKRWHRNPSSVPEKERHELPSAVLEIKLLLPRGFNTPEWVEQILSSSTTQPIPKFSKYVHGCAVLLGDKVDVKPDWWEGEEKGAGIMEIEEEKVGGEPSGAKVKEPTPPKKQEASGLSAFFDKLQAPRLVVVPEEVDVEERRVEPKTYFANERTFIHWANFCVFVQTIGIAFLGFSDGGTDKNGVAKLGGQIYLIIAFFFLLYSLYQYRQRAYRIQAQEFGFYDDLYGPMTLIFVLAFACLFNLVLAMTDKI